MQHRQRQAGFCASGLQSLHSVSRETKQSDAGDQRDQRSALPQRHGEQECPRRLIAKRTNDERGNEEQRNGRARRRHNTQTQRVLMPRSSCRPDFEAPLKTKMEIALRMIDFDRFTGF